MAALFVITCQQDGDKYSADLSAGDKILMKFRSESLNTEWGPDAEDVIRKTVNYEILSQLPFEEGFIAVWLNMMCTASFSDKLESYWNDKMCRKFRESEEISKNKRIIKYTPAGFESEIKFLLNEGYDMGNNIDHQEIDDLLGELDSSEESLSDDANSSSEEDSE